MSFGKYKQPDKVAPVVQNDGSVTSVTLSGKTRCTFHYPASLGAPATSAMTIRQGDTELDGAFASRLAELAGVVKAMRGSLDGTMFTALDVRRAGLADA